MNYWKPIAVCSGLAFAAAVACGGGSATVTTTPGAPPAGCGGQPNMAHALASLQSARGSLARAEHDKGGWRANALQATDTAINETRNGCNYADTH